MKKFMFVSMIVFVFFMVACAQQQMVSNSGSAGGQQAEDRELTQEETVDTLCFTPDADTDFFACTGIYETTKSTIGEAYGNALTLAQDICLNKVEHIAVGLTEEYVNSYGTNRGKDTASKMERGYKNILKTVMGKTGEDCKKQDKYVGKNGRFNVYVGIKISRKAVSDALKNGTPDLVDEEEKEKLDSESSKFMEKIDETVLNFNTGSAKEQEKIAKDRAGSIQE